MDSFSSLIRQTFELSTNLFVPLLKELEYLNQYLKVERARFNNSFNYHIALSIPPDSDIKVPSMLLQPILENAIRHGIRHLPDGMGIIEMSVSQVDEMVIIVISDNGIGIQNNIRLKKQSINTQSITSRTVNHKRIAILNQLLTQKISVQTTALVIDENGPSGTKATIIYPISIDKQLIND